MYFFYLLQPLSRGVTLVILIQLCTLYRPPQALLTHLITFLESHCSVTFQSEPLIPARNYFKNLSEMIGTRTQQVNLWQGLFNHYPFHLLNLILQYTNKSQYKSSFFYTLFVTNCNNVCEMLGKKAFLRYVYTLYFSS